jgi:pyruvate formate lyase activating enzyme
VIGTIFDIKKYSVHDGPGIRTTVFLKGCPLKCVWCHNPEGQKTSAEMMFFSDRCAACGTCVPICPNQAIALEAGSPDMRRAYEIHTLREKCTVCGECVEACPQGAREIAGRVATSDELIDEIMKDVVFYDSSGGGVTFSGGEPLLQPDFLLALLRECKAREIHTAVDTCGFVEWETLSAIVPYADLILYDLKCMDAGMHFELTGRRNEVILENLTRLSRTHSNLVVRFPLIPGINDNEENILSTGEFLSSLRGEGRSPRIDVLPYHRTGIGKYERLGRVYSMPNVPRPIDDMVHAVLERLRKLGLETGIGG